MFCKQVQNPSKMELGTESKRNRTLTSLCLCKLKIPVFVIALAAFLTEQHEGNHNRHSLVAAMFVPVFSWEDWWEKPDTFRSDDEELRKRRRQRCLAKHVIISPSEREFG